jgi:hypothetical protein
MRRSLAVAAALAVLPLAALAGCSAASQPRQPSPPAHVTQAALATNEPATHGAQPLNPPAAAAIAAPATALATFRWSTLASSPLGYRNSPLLAWAGDRLIEVGGWPKNSTGRSAAAASFDPVTGHWQRIASAPPGGSLVDGGSWAAWTGRYLAVASGTAASCAGKAAGCWTGATLYDPAANQWTVLTLPSSFDTLSMQAVVWTGRQLVFGAALAGPDSDPDAGRMVLAAYTPATGRWQMITPVLPDGHSPGELYLVADDGDLVLTALWVRTVGNGQGPNGTWGVDELIMNAQGSWRDVTRQWPQAAVYGTAATGDDVLATPGSPWCGDLCMGYFVDSEHADLINPATLATTRIPAGPMSSLEAGDLAWVWADGALITMDMVASPEGGTAHPLLSGDMTLYDPAAGRWSDLPATPIHPLLATPVWTGAELLTLTANGQLLAFHGEHAR